MNNNHQNFKNVEIWMATNSTGSEKLTRWQQELSELKIVYFGGLLILINFQTLEEVQKYGK